MEREFDESELQQKLEGMVFWKQLVFLVIVCQRLIPSFHAFSVETGFAGEKKLRDLINRAWDTLLSGVSKADYTSEAVQAESLAPDTEDFDSIYVSSALDAAIAISLLMKSFRYGKTDTIVEAVSLIRDSVDMYVQELEKLVPNDPDLEAKILNHKLMQRELKRQREDFEFLDSLNDDISVSMPVVKDKWFGRTDSCLGLTS